MYGRVEILNYISKALRSEFKDIQIKRDRYDLVNFSDNTELLYVEITDYVRKQLDSVYDTVNAVIDVYFYTSKKRKITDLSTALDKLTKALGRLDSYNDLKGFSVDELAGNIVQDDIVAYAQLTLDISYVDDLGKPVEQYDIAEEYYIDIEDKEG